MFFSQYFKFSLVGPKALVYVWWGLLTPRSRTSEVRWTSTAALYEGLSSGCLKINHVFITCPLVL